MELYIKHFSELTAEELYRILAARSEIFVVEQDCVYQDLDGKDLNAWHVWYEDEDGIAAYCRVLDKGVSYEYEGSIGRVIAVKRGLVAQFHHYTALGSLQRHTLRCRSLLRAGHCHRHSK